MTKKKSIFISCNEANHNCDKSQYREASFWEKIKLNLHLIYCRACRKYSSNNGKLSKIVKKAKIECLKPSEKVRLNSQFKDELVKYKK